MIRGGRGNWGLWSAKYEIWGAPHFLQKLRGLEVFRYHQQNFCYHSNTDKRSE